MKRFLFISSVFLLLPCISCEKQDNTDKLSSNPFPYRENDAAGVFTIKNVIYVSDYHLLGEKVRGYEIEGSIAGYPLPENTEFIAADRHVAASNNTFDYKTSRDQDSSLVHVFGQESPYSLLYDNGPVFTTLLKGPQPLVMTAPVGHYVSVPVAVTRKTAITWNADPENSYGMAVEIKRFDSEGEPEEERRYIRIADDGTLTLNSIWSQLPTKGTFWIGLYRGTHITAIGSDSKKYIVNTISVAYSHRYSTKGI